MISRRWLLVFSLIATMCALLSSTFLYHPTLLNFSAPTLHLPMEGLNWINSNQLIATLTWGMLASIGIVAWHLRIVVSRFGSALEGPEDYFKIGIWAVTVGGLGLVVQLLTTEQRLVFGYFPSLALIAMGIGLQIQSHVPSLILVVSLYFSAAAHKLFNFSKMQIYLPESISARLPKGFLELSPELVGGIPMLLSYIVVPLEFSMAALLIVKRTRRWGFVIALIFHTLVSTFTNNADNLALVGLFVLLGHAIQFTLADQRTWRSGIDHLLPRELRVVILAGTLTIGAGIVAYFGWEPDDLIGLFRAFFYFPLIVAVVAISPTTHEETFAHWKTRLWVCILLLWAIYPVLIGYRNQQFGWAMLSGATIGKRVQCIVVESNYCVSEIDLDPAVGVYVSRDLTVIASRQNAYFEKISWYVQTVCKSRIHFYGEAYREQTDIRCRPAIEAASVRPPANLELLKEAERTRVSE